MSNGPPILVLDVDGVIIDGFPRVRWDRNIREDLGINPRAMQRHLFGQDWSDVLTGHRTKESLVASFLETQPVAITVVEFIDYWHSRDANIQQDVIDAMLEWKQRTGGLSAFATNQDPGRAAYLRRDLKLDEYFDVAVVSSDIGEKKPDPAFFQAADRLLQRRPDQVVYFLDDMLPNVIAAGSHGWRGIRVKHPASASSLIAELAG